VSKIGPGFHAYVAIANHPRQKRFEAAATTTKSKIDNTICPATGITLTAMRNHASSIPGTARTAPGRTQVGSTMSFSDEPADGTTSPVAASSGDAGSDVGCGLS
jgi:hypothetical protein